MSSKHIDINEDNQFALSTGDLMAALLIIFILLLIGTMLKLQEDYENKSNIAEKYKELPSLLSRKFSAKVSLKRNNKGKGSIVINFNGDSELDKVISIIGD